MWIKKIENKSDSDVKTVYLKKKKTIYYNNTDAILIYNAASIYIY